MLDATWPEGPFLLCERGPNRVVQVVDVDRLGHRFTAQRCESVSLSAGDERIACRTDDMLDVPLADEPEDGLVFHVQAADN